MNIEVIIEKLRAYSAIHLMTEQTDEQYIQNKLSDIVGIPCFKVKEVDEDEIYDMENCAALVQKLVDFALKSGKVSESKVELFVDEIYRTIGLIPSKLNEVFFDLYDLKPQKAFEWFEDYTIKAGGARNNNAKLIKTDDFVVVLMKDKVHAFDVKLTFQDHYLTEYWVVSNAVLAGQANFRQKANNNFVNLARNAKEFTNKNVVSILGNETAICFDEELPMFKASGEKAVIDGVEIEKLNCACQAIKINTTLDEAKPLIYKIDKAKPQGCNTALILTKKGEIIVTVFDGCIMEAMGVRFIDTQKEKALKLCVKYLTGGAIFTGRNLSEEFKPYEELINYIVSKGKATSKDTFAEVVLRAAMFDKENGELVKNYIFEILKNI